MTRIWNTLRTKRPFLTLAVLLLALAAATVLVSSNVSVEAGGSAARFSPQDAAAQAQVLANEQLTQTLSKAGSDGLPLVQVNGHAVRVADLTQVELAYHSNASSVASSGGEIESRLAGNYNVWVAVWKRADVSMRDWNGAAGTIIVGLVFEDGTGRLLSANVGRINPNKK